MDRTLANGRRVGGLLLKQSPDKDGYLRVKIAGKPVACTSWSCWPSTGSRKDAT